MMRYVTGFARFWWDFIVGDSVVLAIGGCLVLALGVLLAHGGGATAAEFILPAVVVSTVAVSLRIL
jgi:hypothetical protein